MEIETLIRLMGHVETLHLICIVGRTDEKSTMGLLEWQRSIAFGRARLSWVDPKEVEHGMPIGRRQSWESFGAHTMSGVDSEQLLESEIDGARPAAAMMMNRLEKEKKAFPDGWNVPRVKLGYVHCELSRWSPDKIELNTLI